ncbi:hypothetical protein [Streptomyces sp. 1331.2]|uniref:hypothetical protein n=1 Tax=Streptomyces sp. 1331.2 TaxID=1938835 RepID=UPI000BD29EF1|nr:hypothetical protein [Streptomyces sp. 1331.2]SOB83810.1 hypothetical protein SAMN06272789_4025 [Streptomyces sp. 1331.2]
MIEQGADGGEVTYEQVTVVSLAACGPVGPARFAVRVVREGMTVKRVAGYWVRWDERWDGEEVRHHARWVPEEEYVRPGTGSPDGTLAVTVAAYWGDGTGTFPRRPGTETVVTFRPGETEHELVLEQAAPPGRAARGRRTAAHAPAVPGHPVALSVQLAHARWLGDERQPIHYGYSGATESEGGEGEWLVRFPECGNGLLPSAGQAEAG